MSSDKYKFALDDDDDDADFHAPPSLSYVLPQPQQPSSGFNEFNFTPVVSAAVAAASTQQQQQTTSTSSNNNSKINNNNSKEAHNDNIGTTSDSVAVDMGLPEINDNEEELELTLAQDGNTSNETSSGPSAQGGQRRQFTKWQLIRIGIQIFLVLICLKLISLIGAGTLLSYIVR